jgi:hypothetical protein
VSCPMLSDENRFLNGIITNLLQGKDRELEPQSARRTQRKI